MTATIEIKLYATLADYTPATPEAFPIKNGIRVKELAENLGVDVSSVKLVFINGIKKDLEYRIEDGDRVGLFPPVGGG